MRISPGVPSPGTETAAPCQPSISAIPPPNTMASTTVPSGALSCSALPESTNQGMLLSATFPSNAVIPPSASRFAGFSVRTTELPASITTSLKADTQGVVERIRSMVQPARLTGSSPMLVSSNQSLSLSGTSDGIMRVNITSYSPSHSEGSAGGSHSHNMLLSCFPVSSATSTLPSFNTARLSGPAIRLGSHDPDE